MWTLNPGGVLPTEWQAVETSVKRAADGATERREEVVAEPRFRFGGFPQ